MKKTEILKNTYETVVNYYNELNDWSKPYCKKASVWVIKRVAYERPTMEDIDEELAQKYGYKHIYEMEEDETFPWDTLEEVFNEYEVYKEMSDYLEETEEHLDKVEEMLDSIQWFARGVR